jgi:hypothetical protein
MLLAALAVNAGNIAQQCEDKNLIAEKIKEARCVAVGNAMKIYPHR